MKKNSKMYQKVFSMCLLSVFLLGAIAPAKVRADALVEIEDRFWEQHNGECVYLYRRYTVNSPEGYAMLWESPVSAKPMEALKNGTELGSTWRYTDSDGETWLLIGGGSYTDNGKEGSRGWIKTSDCLVVADYISFREVYGEEFEEYDPAYDHAFDEVEEMTLWTYPCSGVVKAKGLSTEWFDNDVPPADIFKPCWRDPKGRFWAFVSYCYGVRDSWICLDDPTGETLPQKDVGSGTDEDILQQDAVIYPAEDLTEESAGEDAEDIVELPHAPIYPPAENVPVVKNGITALTIGGVSAVVAATAGLIWFFFGRKKGNKKGSNELNAAAGSGNGDEDRNDA